MATLFSRSLSFSHQSVAKNFVFLSQKQACSRPGIFRHYTNFWPGILRAREQSNNAHASWRSSLSSPRRQKSQGSTNKISPQQLRPVPLTESTPRYIGCFPAIFSSVYQNCILGLVTYFLTRRHLFIQDEFLKSETAKELRGIFDERLEIPLILNQRRLCQRCPTASHFHTNPSLPNHSFTPCRSTFVA